MRSAGSNLRRVAHIVRVLAAHLTAHLLGERLARWPVLARRLPPGGLSGPRRLAALLEDLGGTFIKFGQMLALQPDILSLEYCNALFDLLDRVAPFPYEEVEATVRRELGRGPDELFDRFEHRPLATASIGQVHLAWRGGKKLAVKVQRPVVQADFAGDVRLMAAMVAAIRRFRIRPLTWLVVPTSEFVAWTREELDYRYEARYMERLRSAAADNPHERVPELVAELTTPRVLTAEFLDGVTVLDYLRAIETGDEVLPRRLAAAGFEPDVFARHMIDNFLGDAFRHGIFHADLHPANLMVLPDNVVGYIDFGITGVLSHYSRHHLIALTLAYTRADLDGMRDAFLKVSTLEDGADPAAFRAGLERMAETWYGRHGRERKLRKNFTLVMLDMLRLSRSTGIWPERDVVKYIRSAIAIDGLITRFAPGFDVGAYLAAVCERQLRQQARGVLFSSDRVADWSAAAGSLARDGLPRALAVLDRIAGGELPVRGELVGRQDAGRRAEAGARAARLAAVACGAALLVTVTGTPPELGMNLFTAEVLIAIAALTLTLTTLRRYA
jgi:ubiquinone biosynthesis protein